MQNFKYKQVYLNRIEKVLYEQGIVNTSVVKLIEFLFTRSIWIKKDGVYKAYLDTRSLICSTLTLSPSIRLLMMILFIRHEESLITYYKTLYNSKSIRLNTYSLNSIYVLLCNVLNQNTHKDILILLPNSVKDLLEIHYEKLYSLFPLSSQQKILNTLRNPSTSLMFDIKVLNQELYIYTQYQLDSLISPLVENNSINLALEHICNHLGINKAGINSLSFIYNNMMLDVYQLNQ